MNMNKVMTWHGKALPLFAIYTDDILTKIVFELEE